jgi:hypothetical protein
MAEEKQQDRQRKTNGACLHHGSTKGERALVGSALLHGNVEPPSLKLLVVACQDKKAA